MNRLNTAKIEGNGTLLWKNAPVSLKNWLEQVRKNSSIYYELYEQQILLVNQYLDLQDM